MFFEKVKDGIVVLKNDTKASWRILDEEMSNLKKELKQVQEELFNLKYPYGRIFCQGNFEGCYEYKYNCYAKFPFYNSRVLIKKHQIKYINKKIYIRLEYIKLPFNTIISKIFVLDDDRLIEIDSNIDFQTCDYDSKNSRL